MKPLLCTLALVALGCHHTPRCTPGGGATVEVRNGSGALVLALQGDALCDPSWNRVGTLDTTKKDTFTLRDAAGKLRLDVVRDANGGWHANDAAGPRLRLYRDAKELRVMRADGVPLGSVVPQTTTGSIIYDKSSGPVGKVSLRDADAVVTDMAGTALTYVRPARDATTAGVFGLPSLDPAEELALYMYWSR